MPRLSDKPDDADFAVHKMVMNIGYRPTMKVRHPFPSPVPLPEGHGRQACEPFHVHQHKLVWRQPLRLVAQVKSIQKLDDDHAAETVPAKNFHWHLGVT